MKIVLASNHELRYKGDSQHGDCRSEFLGSWWVKVVTVLTQVS